MVRFDLPVFILLLIATLFSSSVAKSEQNYYVLSPEGKYTVKVGVQKGGTRIKVVESETMKLVSEWKIEDIEAKLVKFSKRDPERLLIADDQRIKVFQVREGVHTLLLAKQAMGDSSITQAVFDQKDDLLWSTQDKVFKTEITTGNTKKVADVDGTQGSINSLSPLQNSQFAVSQKNNSSISWFSEQSIGSPLQTSGDNSPIVGIFTDDGFSLHAVSEDNNFISWDLLTKQITRKVKLGSNGEFKKPVAVSLNEKGDRLWIAYGDKENAKTVEHQLFNLKKGISTPKRIKAHLVDSNALYRKVEALLQGITDSINIPDETFNFEVDLNSARKETRKNRREKKKTLITGNYDLAKIEADNGDFEAALKFIRKVPTTDPEFRKSRELQKKVFKKIELRNSINAAREQYQQGNFESARILVENVLDEVPSYPAARRLKSLMEKRLTMGGKTFFIAFATVFLVLLCSAALLWYKREELIQFLAKNKPGKTIGVTAKKEKKKVDKKSSVKETNKENAPEKESRNIRRKFLLKFEETKVLLRDSIAKDQEGVHKEKWKEFAAHLRKIEKKAALTPENFPAFDERLKHLQKLIAAVLKNRKEDDKSFNKQKQSEKKDERNSDQDKEKERQQGQSEYDNSSYRRSKLRSRGTPDYYEILGVDERSSRAEVKRAFHKKMQQYHPDKHNTSNFDWIKKEATKMSQLVQEAYEILNDPPKRRRYNENYRARKGTRL